MIEVEGGKSGTVGQWEGGRVGSGKVRDRKNSLDLLEFDLDYYIIDCTFRL